MTGASRARPDDRPRIPYVGRTNPNLSLSLSLLGLRSGFESSGLETPPWSVPNKNLSLSLSLSLSRRHSIVLPAEPPGGPPSTGPKKLRVLNPILRLYRIQPTGKSFRVGVEVCWKWAWQPAARSASCEGGVCSNLKSAERR